MRRISILNAMCRQQDDAISVLSIVSIALIQQNINENQIFFRSGKGP